MQSPIYWHPFLYRTAMKLAYGEHFVPRYERLNKYIPENAEVFECCMGDAWFYRNYLRKKNVKYSCGDINPVFVRAAKKNGIDARLLDVFNDAIPKSDYILVHASLSYFIPGEEKIIRKLLAATKKKLIISESVNNLSNSGSGFKSAIGTFLSKAKAGQSKIKFTRESLRKAFTAFENNIESWDDNPDQREVIIVLRPDTDRD